MIIYILLLILGSVMTFTIYFKENKDMKVKHQQEVFFLEQRIAQETLKFQEGFQGVNAEKQIKLKLSILKKQVALLTFISNQNDQ